MAPAIRTVDANEILNDPREPPQPIVLSSASSLSSASEVSSSSSSSSKAALAKLSKPEIDRLIAENMTSVLKSLKKRKHAKKHARIRQAAAVTECSDTNVASIKGQEKMNESNVPKRRTSPRKRNMAAKQAKKGLKELQPQMSATDESPVPSPSTVSTDKQVEKNAGKENKKVNAFQLMMKSRHKSIGSNSPGKERQPSPANEHELLPHQEQKAKRKLQLEQWAERKGAGKRKFREDADGEYIERQLNKRAKRLKKLIHNMQPADDDSEVEEVTIVTSSQSDHQKQARKGLVQNSPALDRSDTAPKQSARCEQKAKKGTEISAAKVTKPTNRGVDSDDEFLRNLSSPRKKKDSLLGYFNKVSPQNGVTKASPPPKPPSASTKRNKKSKSPPPLVNGKAGGPEDVATPNGAERQESTGTRRSRRSCANRIKDYAAIERDSPPKSAEKKKPTPIVTPLKIINVHSPTIMKVVRSPSLHMFNTAVNRDAARSSVSSAPSTPKSVKLAPLFVKERPPKVPAIDPEKARARQLFLMSGLPDILRQEIDKRAAYEEFILNESPVFPLVSHVTQLEPAEEERLKGRRVVDFRNSCIKLRPPTVESPAAKKSEARTLNRKILFGTFTTCNGYDYEDALERCISEDRHEQCVDGELPEVANVKEIVREYKQRYQHFPVYKCYKQFRAIYEQHQQQEDHQAEDARGSQHDESIEFIDPMPAGCRNGELLFTEKYKPQSTDQILVNFVPATMLKRFLMPWQDEGGNGGNVGRRAGLVNGDYFTSNSNSGDEEHSNESTGGTSCNHVVLVGPSGCGKTCNVYAVANEMHFQVLEINASSRRKGRLILQELLEATQSHQVRKSSTDGLLVAGGSVRAATGKGVAGRLPVASLLSNCLQRRPSCSEGTSSKSKLSLILIEDVDIVFEQDEGFLGAINQLVASSKRPIVLTTTNPSCPHLARYMNRHNVIRYVAPGIENVAKFLSLLALVERVPIDKEDIGRLYARNGKDMRKTLNELQFYIHSEDPEPAAPDLNAADQQHPQSDRLYRLFVENQNETITLELPLAFDTLWCNMELALREAKNFTERTVSVTPKGRKKKRKGTHRNGDEAWHDRSSTIEAMGELYDNISRAEVSWAVMQQNRIRHGRDPQDEQQQQQLSQDIAHTLLEASWIEWFGRSNAHRAKSKDDCEDEIPAPAKKYDGLRKFEPEPIKTIASYVGVSGVRSRVTSCDYEPILRQICRTERDRSMQERRGSRFYHYLRNFTTPTTGVGTGSVPSGFGVDHFEALSHRFERASEPEKEELAPNDSNNVTLQE
ncbi:enhanced level of genomic instability 1 [Anopheles cruzii]|uniref:enhanced level of genomic instability 1 n=1 Tax=Anopheles cruzii TaxID=68878 RepID=UPI0022EC8774|nr:enhanced level of genomic instability 1 [Anopheles cruzii]